MPFTIAPIPCSRTPNRKLRPPRLARLKSPAASISVLVDGARSAEPPTSPGILAATCWRTLPDALRVATFSPTSKSGGSILIGSVAW